MTSVKPPPAATLSARAFLLGDRDDSIERVGRALAEGDVAARLGGGLGRLTATAAGVLNHRLALLATDLTDIDLGDVVVAGWKRYAALAGAAWRTLDDPGSEELVDLAAHRISSVHRPAIDVFVDDVAVASVPLTLELEVLVRGLVGTVTAGRLTSLEGGRCELSARLSCFELIIAERTDELELGAVLDLGAGVPIAPAHGHTPAA